MSARPFALYFIASSNLAGGRALPAVVAQAVAGGVTAVQLREKNVTDRQFYELGTVVRETCRRLGALFLVNDRVDLALALAADGIHLGQDDLPPAVARRLLGPQAWVGVSVETADEAAAALTAGASYLATGPVFATQTKLDAGSPYGPVVVQRLRAAIGEWSRAADRAPVPLVAIGGINAGNGNQVLAAGADGLAVSSALGLAPDPAAAARSLAGLWTR